MKLQPLHFRVPTGFNVSKGLCNDDMLLFWPDARGTCVSWKLPGGAQGTIPDLCIGEAVLAVFKSGTRALIVSHQYFWYVDTISKTIVARFDYPPDLSSASRIYAIADGDDWWVHFGWWKKRAALVKLSSRGEFDFIPNIGKNRIWPKMVTMGEMVVVGGGVANDKKFAQSFDVISRQSPFRCTSISMPIPSPPGDYVHGLACFTELHGTILILFHRDDIKSEFRGHSLSIGSATLDKEFCLSNLRKSPQISAAIVDGQWTAIRNKLFFIEKRDKLCSYDITSHQWVEGPDTTFRVVGMLSRDDSSALVFSVEGAVYVLEGSA